MEKKVRTTFGGKVIITEGKNKMVIINNPRQAARYMKRTAIVIKQSPVDVAADKVGAFMHTTMGKAALIGAAGAVTAGVGTATLFAIRRHSRLRKAASAILDDASIELDIDDVSTMNEFISKVVAYVATHQAYLAYNERDKMTLLNLIKRTCVAEWINISENAACNCGCEDNDEDDDFDFGDSDDDDDFDDDDVIVSKNVPEAPTPDEVNGTETADPEVTVKVAEVVEAVQKEPYAPQSAVEKFNARLAKKGK